MKKAYIKWHLGLGDAIVCVPIVARMAASYDEVAVPAYGFNMVSVRSLFATLPNVVVVPSEQEYTGHEVYPLGSYLKTRPLLPHESFDQWFYRQAWMDMAERDTYNILPEATKQVEQLQVPAGSFAFIHDDKDRQFVIDKRHIPPEMELYYPTAKDRSILAYAGIIRAANEIHCIDSAFIHLCDALPTTGKLYWHRYARRYESPLHDVKFRKDWIIL